MGRPGDWRMFGRPGGVPIFGRPAGRPYQIFFDCGQEIEADVRHFATVAIAVVGTLQPGKIVPGNVPPILKCLHMRGKRLHKGRIGFDDVFYVRFVLNNILEGKVFGPIRLKE